MKRTTIHEVLQAGQVDTEVTVAGWIRTVRSSKGGFSFLAINDGSCLAMLQVVADQELPNPVFVFCVYLPDGKCATQWVVSSEEIGEVPIYGKGKVYFHVERLMLGRSAYVASAAIYKNLRKDGQESKSYHVLDRCIHFEVLQDIEDKYEYGLCVQPFKAKIDNGSEY